MTARPILMSAPMVRALLSGAKSQTRRVVKPQPGALYDLDRHRYPYQKGQRLWVRETWAVTAPLDQVRREYEDIAPPLDYNGPYYRADGEQENGPGLRWRPSIHMPRWVSRITLEIDEVRVQRVTDITDADALDEGVTLRGVTRWEGEAREAFRFLWDSINAKRGFAWDALPWVWAITFHRVEEPR